MCMYGPAGPDLGHSNTGNGAGHSSGACPYLFGCLYVNDKVMLGSKIEIMIVEWARLPNTSMCILLNVYCDYVCLRCTPFFVPLQATPKDSTMESVGDLE